MNSSDRLELIELASKRLTFWSQVLADALAGRDPGVRTPEQQSRTQRDREAEELDHLFRSRARRDDHRKPARPQLPGVDGAQ